MSLFEALTLPREMKEEFCRSLLAEFGVDHVRRSGDELLHKCPMPWHDDRNPSARLNFEKLVFTCLAGETVVKTFDGEFPISELSGKTVRLLDGNGQWVEAPVREYGTDRLYRVRLTRNGVVKDIYATADHRWYVRPQGSKKTGKGGLEVVTTKDLVPRQRIPSVWPMKRTGRIKKGYERTHWWVSSVEETDRVETVYCAEVPTTHSFVLEDNVLTGNCWSCQSSGGLLWFIATVRGGSMSLAREWVLSTTGLDGEDTEMLLSLLEALSEDPDPERPPPLPSYSRRVLEPWAITHPWLTDPFDPWHPEVSGRGIPEENVVALDVGYARDFPVDDKGTTSERIIVPHFWKDKLVGWQSRRLALDGTPKWLSTPDFPRDGTIFRPPEGPLAVVVESPMTVLRHIHHLPMTATFGGTVTDTQIRLLANYERVVYFPDPDTTGWRSLLGTEDAPGVIERLTPYTELDVVSTDWSVDGADMDDETVAELVEQAVPGILWEPPEALRCWTCKKIHTGEC